MTATPISLFTYVNSLRKELQNKAKKHSAGYPKKKSKEKKKEGALFFKVRREPERGPLSKSVSVSYVEKCFAPPPLLRTV